MCCVLSRTFVIGRVIGESISLPFSGGSEADRDFRFRGRDGGGFIDSSGKGQRGGRFDRDGRVSGDGFEASLAGGHEAGGREEAVHRGGRDARVKLAAQPIHQVGPRRDSVFVVRPML